MTKLLISFHILILKLYRIISFRESSHRVSVLPSQGLQAGAVRVRQQFHVPLLHSFRDTGPE